jgi:hypothetical protein
VSPTPPDRTGRRRAWRRLWTAAVLTAGIASVAGCGSQADRASTVAQPVAPPDLPRTSVPRSHAVEPRAGDTGPTKDKTPLALSAGPAVDREAVHREDRILSAADRTSFERLGAALGGQHGLAVSALGSNQPVERVGTVRSAVAWSTGKVPVAMAVIAAGQAQAEQQDLTRAITASDNAAATRLWSGLGGGATAAQAATEQLRQAGDQRTQVEHRSLRAGYTPFGQTRWALVDQARFTAGLGCSSAGPEVLRLMNQVVAGQRWGLGAIGVDARFKGGWGPGSEPGVPGGYLDRQMGVITIDGKSLAVAIASRPQDGSHETGTRDLTAIARWLAAHANVSTVEAEPSC